VCDVRRVLFADGLVEALSIALLTSTPAFSMEVSSTDWISVRTTAVFPEFAALHNGVIPLDLLLMSSPTQRRNWTTADWSYLAAMSNAFTPNPASPFGERAMTRSASILPTATAIVHIEMLQGFKFLEALAQLAHIRKLLAPSQVHLDMLQGFKLLEALAQLAHIRKLTAPTEVHHEMLQVLQTLEALAQLAQTQNAWSCSAPS